MKLEIQMHPVAAYLWLALIILLTAAMIPFFVVGWAFHTYNIVLNLVSDVMIAKIDEIERRSI